MGFLRGEGGVFWRPHAQNCSPGNVSYLQWRKINFLKRSSLPSPSNGYSKAQAVKNLPVPLSPSLSPAPACRGRALSPGRSVPTTVLTPSLNLPMALAPFSPSPCRNGPFFTLPRLPCHVGFRCRSLVLPSLRPRWMGVGRGRGGIGGKGAEPRFAARIAVRTENWRPMMHMWRGF